MRQKDAEYARTNEKDVTLFQKKYDVKRLLGNYLLSKQIFGECTKRIPFLIDMD